MTMWSKKSKRSQKSDPGGVAVILLSFFLFVVVLVFFLLAGGDEDTEPVLFSNTLAAIRNQVRLDITAPDYLFGVMGILVTVSQLLWHIYSLGLICRKSNDRKGFLYFRPPFLPKAVHIAYIVGLLFSVAWLALFTEGLLELSFFALIVTTIAFFVAFGFSAYGLRKYGPELHQMGNRADIFLDRLLVQNGLGLLAVWVLYPLILNLGMVLKDQWGVEDEDANTIALAIYAGLIVLYFGLDVGFFTVSLRFVFMPYVVIVLPLAAILTNDWELSNRNCLFVLWLLSFAAFAFFFKLGSMIYLSVFEREPFREKPMKNVVMMEELETESSDDESEDSDTEKQIMKAKKLLNSK